MYKENEWIMIPLFLSNHKQPQKYQFAANKDDLSIVLQQINDSKSEDDTEEVKEKDATFKKKPLIEESKSKKGT